MTDKPDKNEVKLKFDKSVATEEDVAKLFELVLKAVDAVKGQINSQMTTNHGEVSDKTKSLLADLTALKGELLKIGEDLKNTQDKSTKDLADSVASLSSELKRIEGLIPEIDFQPLEERIKETELKIPKIPEELSSELIRDKLENLEGDDRLDASAIKGLPKAGKGEPSGHAHSIGGLNISVTGQVVALNIPVQSSAPSNPELNMLWIET